MEKTVFPLWSGRKTDLGRAFLIWRKLVASFHRLGVFLRKNPVLGSVYHGIFHRSKECLRFLDLLRRIQVCFYSILTKRMRSAGMPSTRRMPM